MMTSLKRNKRSSPQKKEKHQKRKATLGGQQAPRKVGITPLVCAHTPVHTHVRAGLCRNTYVPPGAAVPVSLKAAPSLGNIKVMIPEPQQPFTCLDHPAPSSAHPRHRVQEWGARDSTVPEGPSRRSHSTGPGQQPGCGGTHGTIAGGLTPLHTPPLLHRPRDFK